MVVGAGFHAAAEHLTEGGQDAEFQEGHPERETLVGGAISVIHAVEQEKRQQAEDDDGDHDKVGFLHSLDFGRKGTIFSIVPRRLSWFMFKNMKRRCAQRLFWERRERDSNSRLYRPLHIVKIIFANI